MSQKQSGNTRQLQDAFLAFSQMSVQLEGSYRELESRVAELNQELAAARSERLKQLAEKESLANRLASLLEALPGGVVVLDGEQSVVECNPAAIDLLHEPLLGEHWHQVTQRAFAPRSGDTHEVSLRDGRRVSISHRDLENEPGQILLLNDVTETRALQDRVNRQERLSAMGEMTASLAHQIRTPLSAALLYASHLNGKDAATTGNSRFAGKLLNCLRHLERMANDMLVFARGGSAGKETFHVDELFQKLNETMEPQLKARGAQWEIDNQSHGATLSGNHEALLGSLVNLVNNGLEACKETPKLSLTAECIDDGSVCISVEDNGRGIDETEVERIFEPFFTTRSNGTGLGLAVVQAIVRAHHGDIEVVSTPGVGTRFVVTLPPASAEVLLPSGAGIESKHQISEFRSHVTHSVQ